MQEAIDVLINLVDKLQKETWRSESVRKQVIMGVMLSIDKLKAASK